MPFPLGLPIRLNPTDVEIRLSDIAIAAIDRRPSTW